MPRHVITGGLGVGKTTVLSALRSGYPTVAEPARLVLAEHRDETGETTMDHRPEEFVQRLVDRAIDDFVSADESQITVFDRGLPDCIAYADVFGIDRAPALEAAVAHRYDAPIFLAPPWEDIYKTDDMRRATFAQAETFYAAVVLAYEQLGYELVELPRATVEERVEFIEARLA